VVGLPTTGGLVGVLGRDVQSALVPVEFDLVSLEARHLDAEDELAVLLVQFVVVATGSEHAGRKVEILLFGVG